MNDLIRVAQLPVIEEQLRSVKSAVDARVMEALAMECTEDTVQTVKAERAELRKQFDDLEERRKAVKAAVMGPYNQFEAVYKECISDAFKGADASLKRKIDDVEGEIKRRCEDDLRAYFDELCLAHHIGFLRFEQAGVKVCIADAKQKTPKKLREQLVQFVARAASDVDRIADMDDAEEIMVEYQKSLNLADAIGTVLDRHRRIQAQREAAKARDAARAAEAAAVQKVDAVAPPIQVQADPLDEIIDCCAFTVIGATRRQLRKLREFLKQEGIRYE